LAAQWQRLVTTELRFNVSEPILSDFCAQSAGSVTVAGHPRRQKLEKQK